MSLICPYTDNCILYKNWKKQTGDERINIISDWHNYSCIALTALQDLTSEGGIIANEELVKRIDGLESTQHALPKDVECSHIRILNRLEKTLQI